MYTVILFVLIISLAQCQVLKVGIAGLVHGHVLGFFQNNLHRTDIQILGIAEQDKALFDRYAKQFDLSPNLYYASLEELIEKTKPTAVLAYTNTYDHLYVVETCAKDGVHVMMEKPLAVSFEAAVEMGEAAQRGNITVIVNFETTWYASNKAAYDYARNGSIGDVRIVVVRDGHQGPIEIGVQPEFLAWLINPILSGGGALYDFGCYGANLMTWIMSGEPPLTVSAVTQQFKPFEYPLVDDEASVILTYRNATAVLQPSWNWPFGIKNMDVYGRTGVVSTILNDKVQTQLTAGQIAIIEAPPLTAPYNDSLIYFAAAIAGRVPKSGDLSSFDNNLIVSQILDAARLSAKTGMTIKLTDNKIP
jgi:predicted dehydrogenase